MWIKTILLMSMLIPLSASAQKRAKYEFMRNLPVYADSLIADLTYPMAWGNSKIKNFSKWKKAARQKVFDSQTNVIHQRFSGQALSCGRLLSDG